MNNPAPFSGRKKARRYVLQALYGWMISANDIVDIERDMLAEYVEGTFDQEYFQALLYAIPQKIEILETIMLPYLSRPLADLDPIELTILRIGVYELKERLEIPYRVVINESLELAKTFASPESHKFVNGVLDKVAKSLRNSEQMFAKER